MKLLLTYNRYLLGVFFYIAKISFCVGKIQDKYVHKLTSGFLPASVADVNNVNGINGARRTAREVGEDLPANKIFGTISI